MTVRRVRSRGRHLLKLKVKMYKKACRAEKYFVLVDDDPQLPSDQVTKQIRFLLEGIVVAVIALFGVMGNLMSVYILMWRKLDLQVFLRRLLVLLAVFDTLFLVSNFLSYSLQMLSQVKSPPSYYSITFYQRRE